MNHFFKLDSLRFNYSYIKNEMSRIIFSVLDGVWKICHSHCMLPNMRQYNKFVGVTVYPMGCTGKIQYNTSTFCPISFMNLNVYLELIFPKKNCTALWINHWALGLIC